VAAAAAMEPELFHYSPASFHGEALSLPPSNLHLGAPTAEGQRCPAALSSSSSSAPMKCRHLTAHSHALLLTLSSSSSAAAALAALLSLDVAL